MNILNSKFEGRKPLNSFELMQHEAKDRSEVTGSSNQVSRSNVIDASHRFGNSANSAVPGLGR